MRTEMERKRNTASISPVGGLHQEPPTFTRVRGASPLLFFNVDEERIARSKARKQANALGHSMTNFLHPSREPYTRSVCRRCGLKIYRMLNLELAGPALNHYCLQRKEDAIC